MSVERCGAEVHVCSIPFGLIHRHIAASRLEAVPSQTRGERISTGYQPDNRVGAVGGRGIRMSVSGNFYALQGTARIGDSTRNGVGLLGADEIYARGIALNLIDRLLTAGRGEAVLIQARSDRILAGYQ